jgi:hypothetical protein
LPVVLRGCQTWSATLTEGYRPRGWRIGAEEDVLAKREDVTEDWRQLHNEELHDLYC